MNVSENNNKNFKFSGKKEMNNDKNETNLINKVFSTIGKIINNGQERVKKSFDNLKNINFNTDWVEILSTLSNPIAMDFLIDGIPKIFYDIFDYENNLEIVIDFPNVSKEIIKMKTHYKSIKIYIKDYFIKEINLKQYLKKSIKIKDISCQYEGRVLKIQINK